ncbi:hypothetical protein TNCV_4834831 [Trichonephila clavipes]|nr:hypothetical protein TNCV_4834831 [Trichonephila clavipes]
MLFDSDLALEQLPPIPVVLLSVIAPHNRLSQKYSPNSTQRDIWLRVHKNTHSTVPVRSIVYEKNKEDVKSVRRAYRDRLEHAVEWSSAKVTSCCPSKYKQHAEQ